MERNIKRYFIIFFVVYSSMIVPKLFSEEKESDIFTEYFQDFHDKHFFECENGYNFLPINQSIYNVDAFIKFAGYDVPTRDQLIIKITHYYTEYCNAKNRARANVHALNIWNNAWEDLFLAASAGISTYKNNNYIQSFSIALIAYASKNFIAFYKQGTDLYLNLTIMHENAESCDFYMKILKHYYGK